MAGAGEDLLGRSVFHHMPAIQDQDFVGPADHHAQIVRDQYHRHLALDLDQLQQVEDVLLNGYVERRRRLVGDQKIRSGRQAPWRS